jgi:hypothetical protein
MIRKPLADMRPAPLTDAERRFLFEAAMEDQAPFDTIADEVSKTCSTIRKRAYLLGARGPEPELRR